MFKVVRFTAQGVFQSGGEELLDGPGLRWIDLEGPTPESMDRLAKRFGLHPLPVEDCLHLDQRPKIEEYPGHQFVVIQGFSCAANKVSAVCLHEMHFFLGPDWLISVHEGQSQASDLARRRISEDPRHTLTRGVDFVMYLVADALTDESFPVLDAFNDELEQLEGEIFDAPRKEQLQRAFELKRNLQRVRQVLSPQRDVIGLLARRGVNHVQEPTTLYFRDIYDHLMRLYERIDTTRDLLGNALDAYLSVVANRTGEITKQLTIFSTLFLPLSFIVGFFGQNFEVLSGPAGFWSMVVLMVFFPLGMLAWLRRLGWL